MRFLWLVVMSPLAASLCLAGKQNSTKGEGPMSKQMIAAVLPAAHAAYKSALAGDNSVGDAQAAPSLLSKARETLIAASRKSNRVREQFEACWDTWRLCLRLRSNSTEQAARQLIVDQWNKGLREDGDRVRAQLYALSDEWDRDLLTEQFWQLFHQTANPKMISATCYILYVCGDGYAMAQLAKKLDSGIDAQSKGFVLVAMTWIGVRRAGGGAEVRPRAGCPAPEYPPYETVPTGPFDLRFIPNTAPAESK